MFPTFEEYCRLIASLPEQFSSIRSSTLVTYTIGPFVAEVEGQLIFESDYTLEVWELLDLSARAIRSYSYELNSAGERVWWYDPTEHPSDLTLRSFIRIISMFILTSNIIAFPPQVSSLPNPTCRF